MIVVLQLILLYMNYQKIYTTEQYCPFCGEEHEDIEEDVLLNEDWD